jgi:hypothetical protein
VGFTYDLIPVLDGERPEEAYERVYAGGTMISFEDDPPTIGEFPPSPGDREVPATWQREAVDIAQRVFHHWHVDEERSDDGTTAVTLSSPGSTILLTIYQDSITIRRNRWPEPGPACDELALLRAFGASGCVLASGDVGGIVADIRTDDPEPHVPLF